MKTRDYYAPLRPSQALVRAAEVCPDWRMVTGSIGGERPCWWERRADGSGHSHKGLAPAPCGVVCDSTWKPVVFPTKSGRRLPNLEAVAVEETPEESTP